jgi:hypothetical protein
MSNNITQTTLSGSITQTATTINLASVTNIVAPSNQGMQKLYVINLGTMKGELMTVSGVVNGTQVPVTRLDQEKQSFYTGAIVLIAPLSTVAPIGGFYADNPYGANIAGNKGQSANSVITPWVNVNTGEQWLLDVNNIWVPGFNNPALVSGPTATIASVAGTITPNGRLFHVSGTSAITGFVFPTGFTTGSFTIIPDGNFTWTTGDGSIGLAGTAVTGRALTFTYDTNAAKWFPSYV